MSNKYSWVCLAEVPKDTKPIIYAIGNKKDSDHTDKCEMYSVSENTWTAGPDLLG